MANLDAALVQQFLHASVTQGKAVVQPNGVLDDENRETVAVKLGIDHGQPAYPNPIKATQPLPDFAGHRPDPLHRDHHSEGGKDLVNEG